VDDFENFLWKLSRQLFQLIATEQTGPAEPYVEISEGDDCVRLTAELPGVSAEDLKIQVADDEIRLKVAKNGLPVYSEVFETERMMRGEARIRFKNGVLDIEVPYRKSIF
jgi:HSP20 family molecular chaperone IbpA